MEQWSKPFNHRGLLFRSNLNGPGIQVYNGKWNDIIGMYWDNKQVKHLEGLKEIEIWKNRACIGTVKFNDHQIKEG